MNNNIEIDSRFLRPMKASWTKKWYDDFKIQDNIGYTIYSSAVIFPLKRFNNDNYMFGRGGVNDQNGNYIFASAIKDRVEGNYPLQNTTQVRETAVYCGYLVNHWGHFLIEAINRLWFFLKHDKPEYHYVFIVNQGENREITGNFKEFLELIGIYDRIELINEPVCYENVIIPDISFNYLEYYSKEYQLIFDTVIKRALEQDTNTNANRNIYLSRSGFAKANNSEFGLELLDNFFQKNNFEIIYPEQYSLTKLINLMNNAKVVATESGSLSHNMLFCNYNQEFYIIERQTIVNRVQTSIDCVKRPLITYIDADMMIYPVIMGFGPFLMLYNSLFESFVIKKGYLPPDDCYTNVNYIKKCLRLYYRAYKNTYYLQPGLEENQKVFIDILFEGYQDSMLLLGEYLSGNELFCNEQYYIRKINQLRTLGRRILGRLGIK